ncbi:MAG TPA: glycerophosphodiester phosphodiesterase family protein [Kiritimatiellia bacterium]|nr:glycerophosphodiester phosphodiesterase family protein [Kiritimatiellia bacterium]
MKWIAHRGASATAPENTLVAFRRAWEAGADGIECDVRVSSDGVPVVVHDRTLRRVAGLTEAVGSVPWSMLRGVDVGAWKGKEWHGETIPSLEQVLETLPEGRVMCLEIKAGMRTLDALARWVETERITGENCRWLTFSRRVARGLRARWPKIPVWMNLEPRWWTTMGWQMAWTVKEGLAGVSVKDGRWLTPRKLAELKDAGLEVAVWTVNDPERARELEGWGVDAVMTDRIEAMKA